MKTDQLASLYNDRETEMIASQTPELREAFVHFTWNWQNCKLRV